MPKAKLDISTIEIPEKLKTIPGFIEAWTEWTAFRKEIGEPLTPISVKMQLKKLLSYDDPVTSIEQSINSNWTGLFPPKNGYKQKNHSDTPKDGWKFR